MTRLLILYLILTIVHSDTKDRFYFPDSFYKLNFTVTSVDTIRHVFRNSGTVDTSHTFYKRVSGPCVHVQHLEIDNDSLKLNFTFYPNKKNGPYRLRSISILPNSPLTFGKQKHKTSQSKISDLVLEFGLPHDKTIFGSDSAYIYNSKKANRKYTFCFDTYSKVLKSVVIGQLKS